ncbi:uncharacterized protein LOC126713816 isoform X1 [Quercus robur]|uniref:uncharacterized protein LOC126713816 isoform X1 n=1 Tax=Quercus robur TaxID=38942 RepID=UPI0021633A24|nr:uncharacterized protein LOC126713816 isoform X1 [Quercus robur]
MGRESYFYIFHFEYVEDLLHICNEGPWAVDEALLVLERWRPNLVLSHLQLNYISVWVQLHGLPLEYQYPELPKRMGQMMSLLERVNWEDRIPRNIRFMRIKVRIDPWLPVIAGFMLRLDDGSQVWVQCKYERVHKLCVKCGLIGHTHRQCTHCMDNIELMLYRQRLRIQDLHQVQYRYDAMQPQFSNDLQTFHKRRWTTQFWFGHITQLAGHANPHHSSPDHPNPSTPNSSHSNHATYPTTTNHPKNNEPNTTSTQQPDTNHQTHNGDTYLHAAINLLTLNHPNIPYLGGNQTVPPTPANSLISSNSNSLHGETEHPLNNQAENTLHADIPHPLLNPSNSGTNVTSFATRPPWLPLDETNLK